MGKGKIGEPGYFYECLDSTNLEAARAAGAGATHGAVFWADAQTSGKGRRGRSWESPGGKNLYFTLLLRPEFLPERASMLTLVMALAVERGIRKTAAEMGCVFAGGSSADDSGKSVAAEKCSAPGIKWPNDIVMSGKKVCGILTEMYLKEGAIDYVLVGVGVNVKRQEFPAELADRATTLEAELAGRIKGEISREQLLQYILEAFEEEYEIFLKYQDLSGQRERYNEILLNCNQQVQVLEADGGYRGTARGIDRRGQLLVEREDGTVEAVYAGEVSVRGIYGYV